MTTKTVLIVAGVALVGYLLYKKSASSTTGTTALSGIGSDIDSSGSSLWTSVTDALGGSGSSGL